jgi:chromosome segregation ATPase
VSSAEGGKPGGKGKKTQVRYDPDVPMSKEQLAAWRREARRVRNRESAAASRQRIRNRISELEEEVGEWKSKYAEAMERLKRLEQGES